MPKEIVRETKIDKFTQILIDSGKFVVDTSNPLSACKKALEQIEQNNEDKFIENVLNDVNSAGIESLDAVKSLKRLYRVTQVINKAITQDKINRFKYLTVNSILKQNSISDEEFELFVNIVDELTDIEYIMLLEIYKIEKQHEGESFNNKQNDIENYLLNKLNISAGIFSSYVNRLKSKGLIIDAHGVFLSYDTPFYVNIVDGKISEMFANLLQFIEKKGI